MLILKFVTTIREQASEEQRAYWLPKILNWEIIGAYAQVGLCYSYFMIMLTTGRLNLVMEAMFAALSWKQNGIRRPKNSYFTVRH